MKRIIAALIAAALLASAGCTRTGPASAGAAELPAKGDANRAVDPRLAAANDDFGFRLLKALPSGANQLLSPFSVTSALGMTANGATGEAKTAMLKTLALEQMGLPAANAAYADLLARLQTDKPGSRLNVANSLWLREGAEFKPEFLATNRDYYAAETTTARFGGLDANKRIDGWVNERTKGLIPQLFGDTPIDGDTLLVLVNTLYFKSDWADEFDPKETKEETFTSTIKPTKSVTSNIFQVPMMNRHGDYKGLADEHFDAVRLPYKDGKRTMYLFVPKFTAVEKSSMNPFLKAPLEGFLDRTDAKTFDSYLARFTTQTVDVGLPKMKLATRADLKAPLRALGMGAAFLGGFDDLAKSDLAGKGPIAITDVVHAVTVEVDEKGTKAAAGTGVSVGVTAAFEHPLRVVADRPFFFAIRDDASGVVLFSGAVRDPR